MHSLEDKNASTTSTCLNAYFYKKILYNSSYFYLQRKWEESTATIVFSQSSPPFQQDSKVKLSEERIIEKAREYNYKYLSIKTLTRKYMIMQVKKNILKKVKKNILKK